MTTEFPQTPRFSLKEKQKEGIIRMLELNKECGSSSRIGETWQDSWKVILFDDFGEQILSLLLKVGEFRRYEVTLHMKLSTRRDAIPDVPAIYFVMPTTPNILQISLDLEKHMYSATFLNFIAPIPRPLLESLAEKTVETDSTSKIHTIYDQYLNYLSYEDDLFSLALPDSYLAFNHSLCSDEESERNVNKVVDGLFSIIVTMKVVPIIRAPKNSSAFMVAQILNTKIQKHLQTQGSQTLETPGSFTRPVLILLERNLDLGVMFQHAWTYQALVHDILPYHLNCVDLGNKQPHHDLDSHEPFWNENRGSPFPSVAIEIKNHLAEYTAAMEEITKICGQQVNLDTVTEETIAGDNSAATAELSQFVDRIPKLREKKRVLDMHTNIATALLKEIKERELDTFFSLEESLLTKSQFDVNEFLELLRNPKRGGSEKDKLRLILIFTLVASPNAHKYAECVSEIEKFLTDKTKGIVEALKNVKAFNENVLTSLSKVTSEGEDQQQPQRTGLSSMISMTGVMGKVYGGVKALLPKSKNSMLTRIVDSILEAKNAYNVEDTYIYFEPKLSMKNTTALPSKRVPHKEAIVFVMGGGNYIEYQNLQYYAKKQGKKIIYGSTQLFNGPEFLQQFSSLQLSSR